MGTGAHRLLALVISIVAGVSCFSGMVGPGGTYHEMVSARELVGRPGLSSSACGAKAEAKAGEKTGVKVRAEKAVEAAVFEVTAYTANDPGMDGRGVTSTGVKAREWRTVAADPEVLPPGTVIYIPYFAAAPNGGKFVVEDTGSAIRGRRLDIYMASRSEALEFGRRKLRVEILRRGETRPAGNQSSVGQARQ